MVAELNSGFWRFLLDRHYQNVLWAPALRHAFPNLVPANRRTVYGPLCRLNELRNRAAHHEPIYRLDLATHGAELLTLARLIDEEVATWISDTSRVPALLDARPPTSEPL